ncbi:MAG: urate hydroxylase PuuD [Colwellia sp.]|nr:urate hydroxylase PuuD [Colwellia sp.]
MESYIIDWFSLIFRWLHVITGIAWIGASFYFVWLDNSLENPPQWKKDKGIKGDLWSIHGGGIYEVAKYKLAPEQMPATLHWFKWEAYTTWLTGMILLSIIYYLGADAYLIDKQVADLTQFQAITIGLGFITFSWILYEALCSSPLGKNSTVIAVILALAAVAISYALAHLFSGRGAYIHFGAIIGTLMAGNVFRVIMPSQRALIAAIEKGEAPDPKWGAKAKLHSTHNTYLTLPLIFIMISSHYPMTYAHQFNWVILLVIVAITALARQYFVLEHKKIHKPSILFAAAAATLALAIAIAPKQIEVKTVAPEDKAQLVIDAQQIIAQRCSTCHSATPTDEVFTVAQAGVLLDTTAQMQQWAPRIKARTIDTHDMPFMNKTNMTADERMVIARWLSTLK